MGKCLKCGCNLSVNVQAYCWTCSPAYEVHCAERDAARSRKLERVRQEADRITRKAKG